MTKIIRTPTKATGGITPAEKAAMDEHAKLWIARAFRTDPIEPDKIVPAIEGIYAAAGLKKPRVVIAPSPLVMAFAYGAAAAIWHKRGATDSATYSATRSATDSATYSATHSATYIATYIATYSATHSATYIATDRATYSATANATRRATDSATYSATYIATDRATDSATANATRRATDSATAIEAHSATTIATDRATRSATARATDSATANATDNATYIATAISTANATRRATDSATYSATYIATANATARAHDAASACRELAGEFGIQCAARWSSVYQGGNMWAGYACYLTAMRDIIGLRLPEYDAYAHWEQAAIHGGFRVMHPEFCIVSDFPEILRVDDQNRPHCETGPSHRWRDGWSLYHWHGVRVPDHWIEDKANLDPAEVLREQNVEVRMAGCQIIGWAKMADRLNRRVIDGDPESDIGALVELTLPGLPEPGRFLMAKCPRNGTICEGVPRVSDIDNLPINTAIAAQAWRDCLPASEYTHPTIRT